MRFSTTADSYNRAIIAAPTDNFTVVANLRLDGTQLSAAFAWLFGHGTPAATNSWMVGFELDVNRHVIGMLGVSHNVGLLTTGSKKLVQRKWYVCGWSRESTTWRYRLDGVQDTTTGGTSTPGAGSGSSYVNRSATSANAGIAGDVAYIGQWSYVLSDDEHEFLARGGDPRLIPSPDALWSFQGNVPVDMSTNRYVFTTTTGTPFPGEAVSLSHIHYGATEYTPSTSSGDEAATVLVDIQPSSADAYDSTDAAEVYVLITPSGVDGITHFDADTVLVDLTVTYCETYYSIPDPYFMGIDSNKWSAIAYTQWQVSYDNKWDGAVESSITLPDTVCV